MQASQDATAHQRTVVHVEGYSYAASAKAAAAVRCSDGGPASLPAHEMSHRLAQLAASAKAIAWLHIQAKEPGWPLLQAVKGLSSEMTVPALPASSREEEIAIQQAWQAHLHSIRVVNLSTSGFGTATAASGTPHAGQCWPHMNLFKVHVHAPHGTFVRPGSPFHGCLVPPVDTRGAYCQAAMIKVKA